MDFYIKRGQKYVRVNEVPRLYADGVWLVQKEGRSKTHILKLGELSELYPYASMVLDLDDLATFLNLTSLKENIRTLRRVGENEFYYSYHSNFELAKEIFKFLSLSEEERKEQLKNLSQQPNLETFENNGYGLLLNGRRVKFDKKSLKEAKRKLEEKVKELERILEDEY